MGIPENQLEIWSHQGATASATSIYERIQRALEVDPTLALRDFEVFLQGSYRNSTNIRADSDVDVVVMLKETYIPDYSRLDAYVRSVLDSQLQPATYRLTDFRRDVSGALRRAFPNHAIKEGGKSIKVPRTVNNIAADVVPCLEYQLHLPPLGLLEQSRYVEGVWLRDLQRHYDVVNFPKRHYENGVLKHGQTSQWFKPTARIFKNARGWLEERNFITEGTASSNGIECLLFNVPDHLYGSSYQTTFVEVVNWLANADMNSFVCENRIQNLFGQQQWTVEKARTYVGALIRMWEQWGQHAQLRVR